MTVAKAIYPNADDGYLPIEIEQVRFANAMELAIAVRLLSTSPVLRKGAAVA